MLCAHSVELAASGGSRSTLTMHVMQDVELGPEP
jgi:hypothetical protein